MAENPNSKFKLDHNKFSTLTDDEYKKYLGKRPDKGERNFVKQDLSNLSYEPIDWRADGVVNPVQNQGQCGSCWAFSAVASLESAYAIKNKTLYKLSEQQMVDCDTISNGCNGGLEPFAFFYAKYSPIESEKDYPYEGKDETCKDDPSKGLVTVTEYGTLYPGIEAELKAAIEAKPTCVSVYAANLYFQLYSGGILNTDACVG